MTEKDMFMKLRQKRLGSINDMNNSFVSRVSQSNINKENITTIDAFRYIERGCRAEKDLFFSEAINCFVNAGECLVLAAEREMDVRVNHMLLAKAQEVIQWAEQLSNWLENGAVGSLPPRACRGVLTPVNVSMQQANEQGLLNDIPMDYRKEAMELHYTPVATVNPVHFTADGYRMQTVGRGRKPTMMIVITMYNEGPEELATTLRKVCNNIAYLQQNELPGYEADEAWKNIVVCIVSDGRTKANAGTLSFLTDIGVFDEDAMTIFSSGIDTQMHLFERTVLLSKHGKDSVKQYDGNSMDKKFPPLQLVFALKENNAGKLNSHLWFFNAFCNQIDPDYNVLLDCGTLPTKSSFYKLLSCLELKENVGGVCGEIAVTKPLPNLWNLVVAAQHFEYKVSNLLDKATESCFGFVSVLPGAFSAYRFSAIKGQPLESYFKSLTTDMSELGPFYGNMYLAEDRILCFELLARKGCKWRMEYVKDAVARTDVPENLVDLMNQRRRWLNGSFFALLYCIFQWGRIYTHTNHSWIRKIGFLFQYFQMVLQMLFGWFLVGNFFLSVYYVIFTTLKKDRLGFVKTEYWYDDHHSMAMSIFNISYAFLIAIQIIYGLGNKPKHVKYTYYIVSFIYSILVSVTILFTICAIATSEVFTIFNGLLLLATFGVYFIAAALHCEVHHVALTFIQYTIMLPTTINCLMIYAFCNLQDLSWGTKGIESGGHGASKSGGEMEGSGDYQDLVQRQKLMEQIAKKEAIVADSVKRRFDSFRSNFLLFWLLCNGALIITCVYFVGANVFLPSLFLVIALFNVSRLLGSICFMILTARNWVMLKLCLCSGMMEKRHLKKNQTRQQVVSTDSHNTPQSSGNTYAPI